MIMFDFYCDVLLYVPVSLVSSLPVFPDLPEISYDNSVLTYVNSAVDFLSFVLPLNVILPLCIFCEGVLHWRILFSTIDRIKHWLPFWGG